MNSPATSLSDTGLDNSSVKRQRYRLPDWAREPLLHFVVLGGLLFAVDSLIIGRADDPHTIVVGPEVDREAVELFKQSRGRDPNEEELNALHRIWLDNEVLYREGLAMQVDRGDEAIRQRVIFKALSVIDANVKLPAITPDELRAWFENHLDKYDEPVRYDFQEAVLSGDNSESAVRSFVTMLNSGARGDAQAGLRIFKGRPASNLAQSYGEEFPKVLAAMRPGEWRAVQTRDGWRAMQLVATAPAKPADFEIVKGIVLQDWRDATASQQRSAAVNAFARKYRIKYESSPAGGNE